MEHEATPMESGIYTPVSRVLWSFFLCLVIYACVKGYGGPVNWFLSLPMWQPLARLTYAIYLVHMPIMLMTAASTHRPLIFSGQSIVSHFFFQLIHQKLQYNTKNFAALQILWRHHCGHIIEYNCIACIGITNCCS